MSRKRSESKLAAGRFYFFLNFVLISCCTCSILMFASIASSAIGNAISKGICACAWKVYQLLQSSEYITCKKVEYDITFLARPITSLSRREILLAICKVSSSSRSSSTTYASLSNLISWLQINVLYSIIRILMPLVRWWSLQSVAFQKVSSCWHRCAVHWPPPYD